MKSLFANFIICLYILLVNTNLNAQQVKIVDFDLVRDSSFEIVYLDSIYIQLYDSLFVIGEEMIQEFGSILQKNSVICMTSPTHAQKLKAQLQYYESTIYEHEKLVFDTLHFFRTDLVKLLDKRIKKYSDELTQNDSINLIVDKKNVIYFKDDLDVTPEFLCLFRKQFSSSKADWEKEVQLHIQKYQINERLKWNGFENVKY